MTIYFIFQSFNFVVAAFRRILEAPFRFLGRLEFEDLFPDFNGFFLG